MIFIYFFLCLWGIFALPRIRIPIQGPIEFGSNPDMDPDLQHWFTVYKLRDLTVKCLKDSFLYSCQCFKLRTGIADPDPDFADRIIIFKQCLGSGLVGSVSFWASRVRKMLVVQIWTLT
jgi:hypothetical protein